MAMLKGKTNTEKLLTFLVVALLFCYLAVFAVINLCGFERFCTTDMYEDTLVAKLMWEQKTLFPKNYLFGNQLYILATPVLAALLYGVCGSINTAMGLSATVMGLLTLLSLSWAVKPFVKAKQTRLAVLLCFAASLFGPHIITQENGQLFFVMCSFYACYTITFFLVLGDYVRSLSGSRHTASLLLSLLLCFCMGIQSLRQTCITVLPILCFELLRLSAHIIKRSDSRYDFSSLTSALAYLAANIAGVVSAKLVDVTQNTIYTGASVFSGASFSEKFAAAHEAFSTVTGLQYYRGENGWFFALMFVSLFVSVLAAGVLTLRRKGEKADALGVCWWICFIACIAVIASSFVTSVNLRPVYIFTYYPMPALSFAIVYRHCGTKARGLFLSALCVLAAANLWFSYRSEIQSALDADNRTDAKQVCDYAMENGYELIYGSHSYTAPTIAAYSDGALTAGCWDDECIFKISPHINIKNIYHTYDYSRALFVFLKHEVPMAEHETQENGTVLSFCGQFGRYYVYTASNQLLYPISENIDNFPEYNP